MCFTVGVLFTGGKNTFVWLEFARISARSASELKVQKINMAPGRLGPKWIILALAAASDLVFVGAKLASILGSKCSFYQGFPTFSIILEPKKAPGPVASRGPRNSMRILIKSACLFFFGLVQKKCIISGVSRYFWSAR